MDTNLMEKIVADGGQATWKARQSRGRDTATRSIRTYYLYAEPRVNPSTAEDFTIVAAGHLGPGAHPKATILDMAAVLAKGAGHNIPKTRFAEAWRSLVSNGTVSQKPRTHAYYMQQKLARNLPVPEDLVWVEGKVLHIEPPRIKNRRLSAYATVVLLPRSKSMKAIFYADALGALETLPADNPQALLGFQIERQILKVYTLEPCSGKAQEA